MLEVLRVLTMISLQRRMSEAMRERRVADDVEIDERTVASLDDVFLRGPVRLDPSGEAEVERRGGREEAKRRRWWLR